MTDTTPEAVERLADQLRGEGDAHFRGNVRDLRTIGAIMSAGGETLRTLLREREEALARIKGLEDRVAELRGAALLGESLSDD